MFATEGAKVIPTPIHAPKANAFAERWVETFRAECLDWTLVLGRRHLDQVLSTYGHYNAHRPHRGLDLAAPDVPELVDQQPADLEEIDRRDVLGGLIHEYFARAA